MAQQNAWTVECMSKGSHSDDEREKIMVAIHYTLTHNKGTTDEQKIKERLKAKGFSKMFIRKKVGNWDGFAWTCSTNKASSWKVNGTEYDIITDIVFEVQL